MLSVHYFTYDLVDICSTHCASMIQTAIFPFNSPFNDSIKAFGCCFFLCLTEIIEVNETTENRDEKKEAWVLVHLLRLPHIDTLTRDYCINEWPESVEYTVMCSVYV